MTGNKSAEKKNASTWLIFIIATIITIISFNLSLKVFAPPSLGNIDAEREQMIEIDKQLYEVLSKVDANNIALYDVLKKEDLSLKTREKDAEDLYNSIPDREIIKKGFGSTSMVPVGRYKRVVKLREENERDRKIWFSKVQNIVEERGSIVEDTPVKALWEKRIPLMKAIDAQEEREFQYYQTPEGKRNNILKNIFLIIGLLSFMIAGINFFVGLEEIGL